MRVVINGIEGRELVILMYFLDHLDFENKEELMQKFNKYVGEKVLGKEHEGE